MIGTIVENAIKQHIIMPWKVGAKNALTPWKLKKRR